MMADDVWELMMNSFDYERRRCKKEFEEICDRSSYQLIELRSNNKLQGLVGYWDFSKWITVEHLAVNQGEDLNEIVPALLDLLFKAKHERATITLEVDIVNEKSQDALKKIYQENGFIENPFVYIQPSYHKGFASFPQRIMSYPNALSYNDFKEMRSLLYRFVYGKKQLLDLEH